MERFSVSFKRDFNLTKKPDLVLIVKEFFPTQLHSKSGFIFCNNFNSGIYYYSISGYERFSSAILS